MCSFEVKSQRAPGRRDPARIAVQARQAQRQRQLGQRQLNAALALGWYSDFSAPRGPNLALSPWDWLALVGRAWFARSFTRDPVAGLLAQLAGREGRAPRRPRRFQAQLDALHTRLQQALGAEGDVTALVCRHPAQVVATPTRVDVHLALAELPLALRLAGLDRDPGWVPAAGRALAFHFE